MFTTVLLTDEEGKKLLTNKYDVNSRRMELSFCYQRPKLKDIVCSKWAKFALLFFVIIIIFLSYFQFCVNTSDESKFNLKFQNSKSTQERLDLKRISNLLPDDQAKGYKQQEIPELPKYKLATFSRSKNKCIKRIGVSTGNRYSTLDSSAEDFYKAQKEDDADSIENRNESMRKQQLPKALVIGFAKCGTSALVSFLELNSAIKTAKREIHFFDSDENYEEGYSWYLSKMPFSREDQMTIEKTPSYVMVESVPERIKIMNKSIKLIVTVKEPVNRAISEYSKLYIEHRTDRDKGFDDYAIDKKTGNVRANYKPVGRSIYYRQMLKWACYFPLSQIHFVDGDTLVQNPVTELNKIEKFLGLKQEISDQMVYFNNTKGFYCMRPKDNKPPKCLPPKKGRKHQPVGQETVQILKDFYRPWNEKFFDQIGQRFNW